MVCRDHFRGSPKQKKNNLRKLCLVPRKASDQIHHSVAFHARIFTICQEHLGMASDVGVGETHYPMRL